MNKLILLYDSWSIVIKSSLKAAFACLVFYGGALLTDRASSQLELNETHNFILEAIAVIILVAAYSAVTGYAARVLENKKEIELAKRRQLSYAASQVNNVIAVQIKELRQFLGNTNMHPERSLYCLSCVQAIVERAYQHFESFHGQSEKMEDRIDFEVTFMTKSYNDDEITIPAYANRQGRAPASLKERIKNAQLYKGTVTAELYKELRPTIRITPDTADPAQRYSEIYSGQKVRIKSSIVYPVLDNNNELLGTLVVHCNKSNFFRLEDESFWKELLEIYASRLAFEKSRMDLARELSGKSMPTWNPIF